MQIIFLFPKFVFNFNNFISFLDVIYIIYVPLISSVIITMIIYRKVKLKTPIIQKNSSGGFFGTFIGLFLGTCTCSALLIPIITLLGGLGVSVFSFVTTYINEIRISVMILLGLSYYFTAKDLFVGCKVDLNNK